MTGIVVRTQRQESQQRRRVLAVVGGAMFIGGFLVGFVAGTVAAGLWRRPAATPTANVGESKRAPSKSGSPPASTSGGPASGASRAATASAAAQEPPPDAPVLAWQPSHQDERRKDGYHEFAAMGSLAALASRHVRTLRTVTAWEIDSGLHGNNALPNATNTYAFDKELAVANEASATFFVGLQTDVGDEPGVIVYYQENDETGAVLARELSSSIARELGVEDLGRLGVRFYSLDPSRNRAPYRVVVEFRATHGRLALFGNRAQQTRMAKALAKAVQTAARRRG